MATEREETPRRQDELLDDLLYSLAVTVVEERLWIKEAMREIDRLVAEWDEQGE